MAIYKDMPAAVYHGETFSDVPLLSASIAKIILQDSPAHAFLRHPKFGAAPMDSTDAMDSGSIQHALLLGKGGEQISICDFDDFRTKAAQTQRDAATAAGLTPIIRHKYDEHERTAKILDGRLRARGYSLSGEGGDSEIVLTWTEYHSMTKVPVLCRAMLDRIVGNNILDLKTAASVTGDNISRTVEKLGYHVAEAAYRRAFTENFPSEIGRESFTRLFVEIREPYCVSPDQSSGALRMLGGVLWQHAVDTWAECLATGYWPEPTPAGQVHISEPSAFALARMEQILEAA